MTSDAARARRAAIRAEYAAEESEAAEAEAIENQQSIVSVRVPATLAEALRARAAAEKIPTSAYVCRVLTRAVDEPEEPAMTESRVWRRSSAASCATRPEIDPAPRET
jgi:predicted DNA binding CopG/RHH family protein